MQQSMGELNKTKKQKSIHKWINYCGSDTDMYDKQICYIRSLLKVCPEGQKNQFQKKKRRIRNSARQPDANPNPNGKQPDIFL